MDDFGTCEQDGIRGVAGYVADDQCWRDFNAGWKSVLDQLGLESLHTAQYINNLHLIGDKPLSDDDVYRILEPFLRVVRGQIIERGVFGVIVITECAGFDALSKA